MLYHVQLQRRDGSIATIEAEAPGYREAIDDVLGRARDGAAVLGAFIPEVKHPSRAQLRRKFPRGVTVRHIPRGLLGSVTGYGRESANPGEVRVTFDGNTSSRLVKADELEIVRPTRYDTNSTR